MRLKPDDSDLSDSDSKSEGYKTGPDTDFEENYEQIPVTDGDTYIYGARVGVVEDERHAFIHADTLAKVNKIDIANIMCAMLNSNVGGTVYVGITKSGQIRGQNITRKERDSLRLGVDDVMGRFTPMVKHDKYEIKFRPVMKDSIGVGRKQLEERFVVEVQVARSYETFQNPQNRILFRDGPANVEVSVQQLRDRANKEQEQRYQKEIKALTYALKVSQGAESGGLVSKVQGLDLD